MGGAEGRQDWWVGRARKLRRAGRLGSEGSQRRAQRAEGSRAMEGGFMQRMATRVVLCSILVAIESPIGTSALSRTDFEMQPNCNFDPEYACMYEKIPSMLSFQKKPSFRQSVTNWAKSHSPLGARKECSTQGAQSISLYDVPGLGLRGAGAEAEKWHPDVDQRYKQLVPPRRLASGPSPSAYSEVNLRRAAEVAASSSASLTPMCEFRGPQGANGKVKEAVMVLDLDKCAFFGNDSNDMGVAMQWMGKGYEDVKELYRMLLSPQVKRTYGELKRRAEKVHVVIYTMRATFLVYRSCFRDTIIPLRWDADWHKTSQIHFPKSVANADQVLETYSSPMELLEEERTDLRKSLERLLLTRDVIMEELELEELPDLVVTATPKNVEVTVRNCGLPLENSYLWDDNSNLAQQSRVINVPPFNKLPASAISRLQCFLHDMIPPESLDPELVDFMMGASASDRVLQRDPTTGETYYEFPQGPPAATWSLPTLVSSADSDDDLRPSTTDLSADGFVSPVTPDSAMDDSWTVNTAKSRSRERQFMRLPAGLKKRFNLRAVTANGADLRRDSSSDDLILRV